MLNIAVVVCQWSLAYGHSWKCPKKGCTDSLVNDRKNSGWLTLVKPGESWIHRPWCQGDCLGKKMPDPRRYNLPETMPERIVIEFLQNSPKGHLRKQQNFISVAVSFLFLLNISQ